jgi:hypothetical protein
VFSKTLEIRWRDVDPLGHVNNAVYLTYMEELLASWLRPILGNDWVNVHVSLDFRRELSLAQGHVIAKGELLRVGNSSLTIRAISNDRTAWSRLRAKRSSLPGTPILTAGDHSQTRRSNACGTEAASTLAERGRIAPRNRVSHGMSTSFPVCFRVSINSCARAAWASGNSDA